MHSHQSEHDAHSQNARRAECLAVVRAAGRPAAWGPLCPVRRPRLKRTRVWRSESWERGGATHTENCSRIKRCDQSWFLKTFCRGKDVKESEGET